MCMPYYRKKLSLPPAKRNSTFNTLQQSVASKICNKAFETNGSAVNFKLDTGAQTNVITESVVAGLQRKPSYTDKRKVQLRPYEGGIIPTMGTRELQVKWENRV